MLTYLDKILSKLHALSHLSYLNISWALIQSSHIIVNIFQIRTLKRLILHSTDPIIFHFDNITLHPLTDLEYLEIDDCCLIEFFELLKYVGPNVKRIKVRIHYHSQQSMSPMDPIIIDQLLSNHQIPGKKLNLCPFHIRIIYLFHRLFF